MSIMVTRLLSRLPNKKISFINQISFSSKSNTEIPKNVLENVITSHKQDENGVCYDKKPLRIKLEAGKKYSWCLCGHSKTQPFCDGTHRNQQLRITLKPVRFAIDESKEYWLCNCKQTNNRPFCDGSHKSQAVEEMTSIVRQ